MRMLPVILFALLPSLVLAQAPVIEISGANFRPMPVAVAAPLSQSEAAKARAAEFDEALMFDLTACGLFQVLDRKSFLSSAQEGISAGSIKFDAWANVGADSLVKTQLSMDGGQLRGDLRLFTVGTGREELKATHAVEEGQPRKLAHVLANALYKYFTSESGPFEAQLAYVVKTASGKDVYLADWDGGNTRAVTSGGINVLPAVAPAGRGVGFTSFRSGKPEIYVQAPGKAATPLVRAGRMATGIAFSPDGKRIAYSLADGESAQIWVASADGSGAKQLTKTPFFINSSPTWSPDGARLAFVSNRAGSPQIYLMSADGKAEPKRLTFQGNYNQTPSWSPRGDLIAFTARDERNAFDLFTVNVETGKINRLTQDTGNNEEPSFSPNGRLIVFGSNRLGGSRLFVMTFEGNNQVALPMAKGSLTTPDWGR